MSAPSALSIVAGTLANIFQERANLVREHSAPPRMGRTAKPAKPPPPPKKSVDLELALRLGFVVPVAGVTSALSEVQEAALLMIERLPLRAAEIAAAAAAKGELGVGAVLKKVAFDIQSEIADAWEILAGKGRALAAAGPIAVERADKSA